MEPGFESLLPSHFLTMPPEAIRGGFLLGRQWETTSGEVMNRSRNPNELDFGAHEKTVRLIEEAPLELFEQEISKRLQKMKAEGADALLLAGALAAARSTRFEGSARVPHGLLVLSSARALMNGADAGAARRILGHALHLIYRDIRDPGFGPYRLLHFSEEPGDGKEGTLFSFLEAVRAGDTDWADHRFAWLVRNLEKEQVVDCLLSSGLEGVTGGVHKVIGVVEVWALLQGLGWEWAPLLFRPIVRYQASGTGGQAEYDSCRELIAQRDLLHLARRRTPGQAALGERDPERFLREAVHWAESDPVQRTHSMERLLTEGIPLEDAGDVIAVAAALILLQESLRQIEAGRAEEETERRVHIATGVLSMRQLVRLGTPGQRVLGLLLAGWAPPVRLLRFAPESPDSGWWLSPASRLLEPAAGSGEQTHPVPEHWGGLVRSGQPNGLFPLMAQRLAAGATAAALLPVLDELASSLTRVPGLAMKLQRTLGDAYRGSRSPHRWIFVWAAAVMLSVWPREPETAGLRASGESL
jgi:hypothetical protein